MNSQDLTQKMRIETWGFAGTLGWGALIAIVYTIAQALAMVCYANVTYGSSSFDIVDNIIADGTALALATFAGMFAGCLAIYGVITLKKRSDLREYLAIHSVNASTLKHWLLVVLALIVVTDSVTYLLDKPIVVEFMTSIYKNTSQPWLLFLALVIAAPVFEELFFRGFLFAGLSSSFAGPAGAIIITSAAWSLIHLQYDAYGMFMIFVSGIVLGVARLKTNSVLVTIMMHSIMNVVAMIETIVYVALHG